MTDNQLKYLNLMESKRSNLEDERISWEKNRLTERDLERKELEYELDERNIAVAEARDQREQEMLVYNKMNLALKNHDYTTYYRLYNQLHRNEPLDVVGVMTPFATGIGTAFNVFGGKVPK